MENSYHLAVNIRTPQGMLEIGKFYLGTNEVFAKKTMEDLEGSPDLLKYPSIRLDLLSSASGVIPLCLKSIGCNLDQYASNCKILTKEAFRHFMFEQDLARSL